MEKILKSKKKLRNDKGITLVALIITVILMLILVGVAISTVVDGEGLFSKSREATKAYENSAEGENKTISNLMNYIQRYNNQNIEDDNNEENQEKEEDEGNGNEQETLDYLLYYSPEINNIQEGTRPTNLTDKSSSNWNASLQNANYNNGKGVVFDGSSTYGTLDSDSINLTFPLTVTATVNWKDGSQSLLFNDAKSGIGIGAYSDAFILNNGPSYGDTYKLPTDFLTNDVNYVTIVYKTTALDTDMYVNGIKLSKSGSTSRWYKSESGTYLGRRAYGDYFNGILYDFKIYNKNLSEAEVLEVYNLEKNDYENNVTGNNQYAENIILHYDCDEGKNVEEIYPNVIKHPTNAVNDINLYNVNYNTSKQGLSFNGTSSYGRITDSNFNITFPVTVTMAVKRNDDSRRYELLFTSMPSSIGIGFYSSDRIMVENNVSTSTERYTMTGKYIENEINYITVVYGENASDNKVYVNGQQLTNYSSGSGWDQSETGTYIGRRNYGDYFSGILYKLKIYNKAFTESEVISEYENDKSYFDSFN